MAGLREHAALILTIITIVALTVTLNIGNVHALPPPTLTLTPNPITQGTNLVITGSNFPTSQNGFFVVFSDNTGKCTGSDYTDGAISADASGNLGPVTIPTSGLLTVGTHCVTTVGFTIVGTNTPDNAVSSLTVNPTVVPEYPFGLPLLAIFMVIAYGLIKRRTSSRV